MQAGIQCGFSSFTKVLNVLGKEHHLSEVFNIFPKESVIQIKVVLMVNKWLKHFYLLIPWLSFTKWLIHMSLFSFYDWRSRSLARPAWVAFSFTEHVEDLNMLLCGANNSTLRVMAWLRGLCIGSLLLVSSQHTHSPFSKLAQSLSVKDWEIWVRGKFVVYECLRVHVCICRCLWCQWFCLTVHV